MNVDFDSKQHARGVTAEEAASIQRWADEFAARVDAQQSQATSTATAPREVSP